MPGFVFLVAVVTSSISSSIKKGIKRLKMKFKRVPVKMKKPNQMAINLTAIKTLKVKRKTRSSPYSTS